MHAVVELILARVDGDEVRYSLAQQACVAGTDPDETARAKMTALFPKLPQRRLVLHSTSWRYENGELTLTYLGYSDDLPLDDLPLALAQDARETGEDVASVAAHAIRHLAFLARQDPQTYRGLLSEETLSHLARMNPEVAGRIYPERDG